jgi:nitrogen regulatory protein PII
MNKINGAKLITCILRKGRALPLLEALNERGEQKINFAFARGSDIHDPETPSGKLKEQEKEIVTIVADSPEKGEELFDFVYEKSGIDEPGSGLIYMTSLSYATGYSVEKS